MSDLLGGGGDMGGGYGGGGDMGGGYGGKHNLLHDWLRKFLLLALNVEK